MICYLFQEATQSDYNGYYPHITIADSSVANYESIFHCGPAHHDESNEIGTATWVGFNYIELKGSTSVPSDGAMPSHIALMVDAEGYDSNVRLYVNGKIGRHDK